MPRQSTLQSSVAAFMYVLSTRGAHTSPHTCIFYTNICMFAIRKENLAASNQELQLLAATRILDAAHSIQ